MTAAIDADRWSSSGWSRSFVIFLPLLAECVDPLGVGADHGQLELAELACRVSLPGRRCADQRPEAAIDPDPGRFRCGVEIVALPDVLDDEPELGVVLQRVRHGCLHLRRRREPFHLVSFAQHCGESFRLLLVDDLQRPVVPERPDGRRCLLRGHRLDEVEDTADVVVVDVAANDQR